jgi:hypothetical protein
MALSIEVGIARTYAIGALCYVVCAAIMIAAGRLAKPVAVPAPKPALGPGLVAGEEAAS